MLLSLAALAALAALPAGQATPAAAPIATTIAAIAARPQAFDGKWVRLAGQIDQCVHFGCALCPEETTEATLARAICLPLDWDRQRGSPRERGADFDPIYRYASIVVVARFDRACWTYICTDRAPVLLDARVFEVRRRRPSALGLNGTRVRDRMVAPPAAAAAPLIALAMRNDQVTGTEPSPPRYRVFADPHDAAIERGAIICRSSGRDEDPATWPVDQSSAVLARSTEDRFRCHFARHRDGQWMIEPA